MNQPKLIDVTPFEPLIIKTSYDDWNYSEVISACEKLIKTSPSKVHLEEGNAGSSASNKLNPHHMPEFKKFYGWLHDIAMHIIKKEWNMYKDFEYSIVNSWVNYHDKGGTTLEHHHGAAAMVVTTYLSLPEDGGFIQFKDPMEYHKGFFMHNEDDGFWNWKTVPAKTGDIIMFPGWLRHRTQTSNSEGRRWVLTTNINSMNRPPLKR